MANIQFFCPEKIVTFVPDPKVLEDHQNIASYINQSSLCTLHKIVQEKTAGFR